MTKSSAGHFGERNALFAEEDMIVFQLDLIGGGLKEVCADPFIFSASSEVARPTAPPAMTIERDANVPKP